MLIPRRNRKADVPTTILVIGVFVVCGLAIASFFYSSLMFSSSFKDVGTMQKANMQIEKNSLQKYHDEVLGNKFSFNWDFDFIKEVVVFSVEYLGSGN